MIKLVFFSAQSTSLPKPTAGHISQTGKLIFPLSTLEQLSIGPTSSRFRVGVPGGKWQFDLLYLAPTTQTDQTTFALRPGPKYSSLDVGRQLLARGLDFKAVAYRFSVQPAELNGQTAYQLTLSARSPRKRASKLAGSYS